MQELAWKAATPNQEPRGPRVGRAGNHGLIVTLYKKDTCDTPSTFNPAPTEDCAQRTNARKANANKPASTNH
ncbi:MAG: hypothetical protein ACI9SE_002923 [Neolewinella sp.]|jgi:hypothetical protein